MKKNGGKVLSFHQNAGFYNRRGELSLQKNDLFAAVRHYRRAWMQDPYDYDICIDLAELLYQMQRYSESLRILFGCLSMGKSEPEILYGIASDLYGLHEFEYAAQCLEKYLDLAPNGPLCEEAEDFLSFLESEEDLGDNTGLYTDEDFENDGVLIESRHLLDCGKASEAVWMLEDHLKKYPSSSAVRNQLSLAYLTNGEKHKAIAHQRSVVETNGTDARSLTNLAMLYLAVDDREASEEMVEKALKYLDHNSPEMLFNIASVLMELNRFDDAAELLKDLTALMPFDQNVLHRCGYCAFMKGDTKRAAEIYKKLMDIDPLDIVAKHYFTLSKAGNTKKAVLARWLPVYALSMGDCVHMSNELIDMLSDTEEALFEKWATDEHFAALLNWALDIPDFNIKNYLLSKLFSFGDRNAERALRDFILRENQPDEAKRLAMTFLKRMNAQEPYYAYLNNDYVIGCVTEPCYADQLPEEYEELFGLLISKIPREQEDVLHGALVIYKMFIEENVDELPSMTDIQRNALAAGIEYLACKAAGKEVSKRSLINKYRITERRLKNALDRLRGPYEEEF